MTINDRIDEHWYICLTIFILTWRRKISWFRSLTLHAASRWRGRSLTSPTLFHLSRVHARGLRKVWMVRRGAPREANAVEDGVPTGANSPSRRGEGVALTYLCRVLHATPISGAAETNPLCTCHAGWYLGMPTLCAFSWGLSAELWGC